VNRRAFVTALGSVLAAPCRAQAQQRGELHRLGLLSVRPSPFLTEPFIASMRDRGWIESRDFAMEPRYTGPNLDQAPTLAKELLDLKVSVILAITTATAQAARKVTHTVPIVMMASGFPVEAGLAESMARPGGNVTGLSIYAGGSLFRKYVQLLRDLTSTLKTFAVLWNYVPPGFVKEEVDTALTELKQAAVALGVTARVFEIYARADLDRALANLRRERADAVFITSGGPLFTKETAAEIATFMLQQRLPTLTDFVGTSFSAGSLMTYSATAVELAQRSAGFVDRILRGARPAELPIEQPTRFELIINLKTAKALGLTIPPSLLLRADQVIE